MHDEDMADQAEVNFAKAFVNNISQQPVNYADDFQPPLENYLRKVPALPVRIRWYTKLCRDLHMCLY